MYLLDYFAERRISEVQEQEQDDFDYVPGAARPLALDDDRWILRRCQLPIAGLERPATHRRRGTSADCRTAEAGSRRLP